MTAPARVAAYHALMAVGEGRLDLPAALASSRDRLADARDKALAADIVQGTLRWQRALDAVIESVARTGRVPADRRVLTVLRLSLYQILHLDRVPASAVVDDAVDLTRLAGRGQSAGFVNASLRSALRQLRRLTLPRRPPDARSRDAALAYLGITHSHPNWLVARWLERYGFEAAEAWVTFNNQTPPVTLRANALRTDREALRAWLAERGVVAHPTRFTPLGLVVESWADSRVLHEPSDQFVLQDEASQAVSLLLGAQPGDRVLDLCAAPGGKTTAIAGDMQDRGILVACDVRARRVRILRSTVAAAGARAGRVLQVEREGPLPFGPSFDRVLVDAPCSGLGTVRRDPDIKWRRTEHDLAGFAAAQRALLHRAAGVVAPGGRLVYATCSSEPEENEAVAEWFLAEHAGFRLDPRREILPVPAAPLVDDRGFLQTLPHLHGLEAFFAAAFVRA